MRELKEQVAREKEELDSRLSRLQAFLQSETFKTVPLDEQSRLIHQALMMDQYSGVLGKRIAAFTDSTSNELPVVGSDPGWARMARAQLAYEAYRTQSGGISLISGQTIPTFAELLPPLQAAWAAAADAVWLQAEADMKWDLAHGN